MCERETRWNYQGYVLRKNEDNLKRDVTFNVVIISPLLSNAFGTSTFGNLATDPFEEPKKGYIIKECGLRWIASRFQWTFAGDVRKSLLGIKCVTGRPVGGT
jgi:hypothetical protein